MRKVIEEFPDYEITDDGKVWSSKRNKWLNLQDNGHGYLFVSLCRDGKKNYKKIHRLVAEAFIPNPEGKPTINHIDSNRLNNSIDNLEWVTQKENIQHAWKNKRCEKTRKAVSKNGKMNCKIVICLETGQMFNSAIEASRAIGLNDTAVPNSIKKGYRAGGFHWKYL